MRRPHRTPLVAGIVGVALALISVSATLSSGCNREDPSALRPVAHLGADERAKLRAYDGAPPVLPMDHPMADCVTCHQIDGDPMLAVMNAPPSPHGEQGHGAYSRCVQCHVRPQSTELFDVNTFVGLPQDLRHGPRAYAGAPPRIPHQLEGRAYCAGCHVGPTARDEIRTSHPERDRCTQCHVPTTVTTEFTR